MKHIRSLFLSIILLAFFNTINAQNSFLVSAYGDTLICDSVGHNTCIVEGKNINNFSEREIVLSVYKGETFVFKNGFNKGKVVMASDSMFLTVYRHTILKHGVEKTNVHIFFIRRSDLKILHNYSSWYSEGAEIFAKYFPDTGKCPKYKKALTDYNQACRKGIRVPTIEGRAMVRAWNDCFPLK